MASDELSRLIHSPSERLLAVGLHFQTWDYFHRLISQPDPGDPVELRVVHALPWDIWELIHREQHALLELNLNPEDGQGLTNGPTDQILNAILARCPKLVRLSIPGCWNAGHITATAFLPHLTWLDISSCFHVVDIHRLAQGSAHLTHLNLNHLPHLTDEDLVTFISRNPGLTSLNVAHDGGMLTSTSVEHITYLSGQLTALDLSTLRIHHLWQMLAAASWPQLTDLKLAFCDIDQETLVALLRQMPRLTGLNIQGINPAISDEFLLTLGETCPNLKLLDVSDRDDSRDLTDRESCQPYPYFTFSRIVFPLKQ